MKSTTLVLSALLVLLLSTACIEPDTPAMTLARDLRGHVEYLASDELGGRETGAAGVRQAEEYIAQSFRRYGLQPLPGQDGFFVPFKLFRGGIDTAATRVTVTAGGETQDATAGTDFRPFFFSQEGTREAEVVFAGYGITAPEYDYDDYEGLDVEGKFVLVLRHEPGEADPVSSFDGTENTDHANFTTKADNADSHGAAGMILVTDPTHDEADDMRLGGAFGLEPPETGESAERGEAFLAVHVTRQLAETMARTRGSSLAELHEAVEDGIPPAELALANVTARISVSRRDEPVEVEARNVIGFLAGSDPELRREWIVIGGHHDHEGGFAGPGDTVFNGADDNASGTSGVLELARRLAAEPPARSLVFATFSAEEKGLLGSRALVRDAVLPLDKVVFMLNLDMIGRNPDDPVQVYGDGYVKGLREVVEARNAAVGLDLTFAGDAYAGNSDHDSFYREDVPFLFFFTGTHEDYHQLSDHADKLDYARMEKIVRLASGVVDELAGAARPLTFIHQVGWLGLRVEVEERGAESGATLRQAVITAVEESSRAAKAGLEVGDVIAAFDATPLEEADQVGRGFRDVEPGTRTELTLRRGGEELRVAVERARVGFLGVVPDAVDDDVRRRFGLPDNEGVVLLGLSDGGPAEQAGLRVDDLVLRISGQPVSMTNLGRQLAQIGAGETVQVTILRDGQRQDVSVTLGQRPRG